MISFTSISWAWGLLLWFSSQTSFAFLFPSAKHHHYVAQFSSTSRLPLFAEQAAAAETMTLPALFPELAVSLTTLGFVTPTPIQLAMAQQQQDDGSDDRGLLLIAPTGSGKTLAYLVKAITKAMMTDGTILVVAPTRELAVQLGRDATALLANLGPGDGTDDDANAGVILAVSGIPTPTDMSQATMLIGTPLELIHVISNVKGGGEFIQGDTLCSIILDEVDVLLPLAPKQLRTSLDDTSINSKKGSDAGGGKKKSSSSSSQDERRKQEQKRKLMTAKRLYGAETTSSNKLVAPTERLLSLIASNRFVGTNQNAPPLVLAGSATASRRTLDRLNQVLKNAAESGAAATMESVWSGMVKTVRPNDDKDDDQQQQQHTIRAVSVPQQVKHRYISLSKEEASSSAAVLSAVAKAATILKPETALVFICGEFAKSNSKEKTVVRTKPLSTSNGGKAGKAARLLTKRDSNAKANTIATMEPLSARRACTMLKQHGMDAQPLHVALGLEMDVRTTTTQEDDDAAVAATTSPFLVTFEGSARGLHLEEVDAVFVVGRPASAASYLHLAGRVGRSFPSANGGVMIRPGTVVSFCTKGSATELNKWTRQVGGTDLEELVT